MLKITYEVNGKKIDPKNFSSEMEQAILPAVAEKATEVVKSKLSVEEVAQITIVIQGSSLDDLSMNVRGPEEIIKKLTDALD